MLASSAIVLTFTDCLPFLVSWRHLVGHFVTTLVSLFKDVVCKWTSLYIFFILCIGCCQKCLILNKRFVQKSHRHLFRLCWTQLVCKINLCLVRPLDFWTERMLPQSLLCTSKLFCSRLHGGSAWWARRFQCEMSGMDKAQLVLSQYFHLPDLCSHAERSTQNFPHLPECKASAKQWATGSVCSWATPFSTSSFSGLWTKCHWGRRLRPFIAGLHPVLQAKLCEFGVVTLEDAVKVAMWEGTFHIPPASSIAVSFLSSACADCPCPKPC